MSNSTVNGIIIFLIFATVGAGIIAYPSLPPEVASHWDVNGEVNGYMQKFWGVFLVPMIMAGLFIFYLIIPTIDPYRANIETFRKQYSLIWLIVFGFLSYIFGLTLAWNVGYRFDFTIFIIPAFALMWYFLGDFLKDSKRNWFVGIRTPWTLSSDVVWEKTHRLGATLFKLSALLSLFGLLIPNNGIRFFFGVIPVLVMSVVVVVYSYVVFRKEIR
ncbi:MAG: DUF1648 domain-containing protein [Patescibacteria group bacterium]|nr:DUF1648 domain-containing protein [bacterium]MDZ4240878.1 DUF1648 domain-containing protein [Patescibacteria group bacterium]